MNLGFEVIYPHEMTMSKDFFVEYAAMRVCNRKAYDMLIQDKYEHTEEEYDDLDTWIIEAVGAAFMEK